MCNQSPRPVIHKPMVLKLGYAMKSLGKLYNYSVSPYPPNSDLIGLGCVPGYQNCITLLSNLMNSQVWEQLTLTGQSSRSSSSPIVPAFPWVGPILTDFIPSPLPQPWLECKGSPLVGVSLDVSLRSSYLIPSDKIICSLFCAPKAQSS